MTGRGEVICHLAQREALQRERKVAAACSVQVLHLQVLQISLNKFTFRGVESRDDARILFDFYIFHSHGLNTWMC